MGTLLGQRIRLALGIAAALGGIWFVYTVRGILAPFVLAFVLAYVMTPLVDRMEGRGIKRTPSILVIFLLVFSSLAIIVVFAGSKMTGEMVRLSGDLLRPESREVELVLTNTDERRVFQLNLKTASEGEKNPFKVVQPPDGRLSLQPGSSAPVRVLFEPDTTSSVTGDLVLGYGAGLKIELELLGNLKSIKEYDEHRYGTLHVSATGIDFGEVGPNIVTEISSQVAAFEPHVQSIVGQDVDLEAWIKTYGSQLIDVLLGRTTQLLSGVVSGIMLVVIVPFVAFFFLKEGRRITHGLIELVPNGYFEITLNLMHSINNSIGGYIRGQLLAVSVVALLSVTGLSIINMDYALPVGMVAGLANMIPYLGPLIGIISATIVALATGGGSALVMKVIILFLLIQIIDNVLIQPIVVAKSVDLHPLVVMVVVMIGSDLWGMVGMLVAVPVTGILKVSGQTVFEGLKGYRT